MPRRYEDVLDQLIDVLAEGRFVAGDWLPSERHLAEWLASGRGAVREAIAARATAEREAASLAVRHATPGDLALLRERLDEMDHATALERRSSERDDPFVEGEAWFHHTLVLLSRNRVLATMSEPLHLALAAIRHRHAPGREGAALTQHRRILEGVSSREAELAVRAVDGYARQLSLWLPE